MFSCFCCSTCCMIFSIVGVIFLAIFGAMIRFENVSFEHTWGHLYVDVAEKRDEKVRYHPIYEYHFILPTCSPPQSLGCFMAAGIYLAFAIISAIGFAVTKNRSS